ncbi:MAG: 2-amino-4-hydroxy-6-hydroxymethyldihydropteridine diphosphokinase [Bernardetiaceae bacterium]|jgi:2-amino-4-hydroxy-6-hydroxymethyldihydropteridine diphosphokinase|nr:2-amino-4-hydroxy-6-hydroxymethyldihydropteridine diphosphokinase [Bernardetiaceae bacterium]
MGEIVFVGLGSNLGDRAHHLAEARTRLATQAGPLEASSAVYQTEPWGLADQPAFYNQVVQLATGLPPRELLAALLAIEQQMGRHRQQRWGPRLIDLDILLYANQQVALPELTVPHPQLANRRFVLVPLAQIAAEVTVPGTGQTVAQLLANCPDTLRVWPVDFA